MLKSNPQNIVIPNVDIFVHLINTNTIEIMKKYGVDSNIGFISAILQGGNDTTVYVMGLYFGVCGIKKTHHAYIVGIICDLICFILCLLLFFIFM